VAVAVAVAQHFREILAGRAGGRQEHKALPTRTAKEVSEEPKVREAQAGFFQVLIAVRRVLCNRVALELVGQPIMVVVVVVVVATTAVVVELTQRILTVVVKAAVVVRHLCLLVDQQHLATSPVTVTSL
jgi:hypothetical protein